MRTAASFSKVTCYYSCPLLKASCTSKINVCTLPRWLENSQLHFACHVAMKKPICSFPAAYENPLNTREAGLRKYGKYLNTFCRSRKNFYS
jgi:hypothetical protein